MKERYGSHLWLNVVSKCDLLKESPVTFSTENCDHDDIELQKYRRFGPDGALLVSVKNDIGLNEVIVYASLFLLVVIELLILGIVYGIKSCKSASHYKNWFVKIF